MDSAKKLRMRLYFITGTVGLIFVGTGLAAILATARPNIPLPSSCRVDNTQLIPGIMPFDMVFPDPTINGKYIRWTYFDSKSGGRYLPANPSGIFSSHNSSMRWDPAYFCSEPRDTKTLLDTLDEKVNSEGPFRIIGDTLRRSGN